MDQYNVGQVYIFNGTPYRYKGGPADQRSSWDAVSGDAGGAEQRIGESTLSPGVGGVYDFLRMAAQGATFGFADELAGAGAALAPGGKNYAEARDASRQRVADLRETNGLASALAQGAGGLMVPAGAARAVVPAATARFGMLGAAAAGAGVGAAEGGLLGVGESDAPTFMGKVKDSTVPAAIGAGVGAVIGPIGEVLSSRAAQRGPQLAKDMRSKTGLTRTLRTAVKEAEDAMEKASDKFYAPIDEALPDGVSDQGISSFLESIGRTPPGGALPKFQWLQRVRTTLRKAKDYTNFDQLTSLMEDAIPGYAKANEEYAKAARLESSLRAGRKLWNASSDDIKLAQDALKGAPDALRKFREGQVHEWAQRLRSEQSVSGPLTQRVFEAARSPKAAPEMRDALRTVFPDDQSFAEFMRAAKRAGSISELGKAFRKFSPWVIGATAAERALQSAKQPAQTAP